MEVVSLLALLALWAPTDTRADTNLDIPYPYNCSTRITCSSLRLRLPVENEEFDATLAKAEESVVHFDLINKRGDQLKLSIGGVKDRRFRVIVEEYDRHRYKLDLTLEKEPEPKNLKVATSNDTETVITDDEGNRVVVKNVPLTIEFYHDDVLEQVLEGNRIIFENTDESQAFTFAVRFNAAERLMGLHEHADHLELRHTADFSIDPYRLRNTDYGATKFILDTTQSMYGSIPVIYGFGKVTSGIFHNNAAEQWIDVDTKTKSAYFMVDGGRLDLFVLLGPSLKETVRQYVDLTGKPHLPQLWALGYHQCRWAYNTTDDVMDTINHFDLYDFPLDVLWLDIEYTSSRKWFTWNATAFPDPVELLNWVDGQGHRKLVPISDPHIKIDPDYKIYTDLLEGALFVNNSDGNGPFVGECWPGNSSWVDYLNPGARDYYARLHLYENFPSTPALGGFWNDMNEPTLFDNLYERTFPFDLVHYGGVRHRDVHNIYGMLQTMSTHKGLLARDNGTLRPFILSRAYFAGSQRYANKWSGDNEGLFEDLRYSVPMALTSNLVGLAFYGADIPGFNGRATEELLIRWYELGIWLPFFRAHAALGTPRREPFRFGNETQKILRDHMRLRYKHLPYWYTVFYEHVRTGDPIVRPLLYQYPEDPVGYDLEDEFLVGGDILVASVYESEASSVTVYFPGDDGWLQVKPADPLFARLYPGKSFAKVDVNITYIPVFYRRGSIISRKPRVLRSVGDIKHDPLELHCVLDKDGLCGTTLYVDDYESFDYVDQKKYSYFNVKYDAKSGSLSATSIDDNKPSFAISVKSIITYDTDGDNEVSVRTHERDGAGRRLSDIDILRDGQVQLNVR